MTESYHIPKAYSPPLSIPPGETIKEMLESRGMTQLELSRRMGRPEQAISEIVNAKKEITKETAIQLERVLGLPASFWFSLERNYQASLAREYEQRQLTRQMVAFSDFPYREMVQRGYLHASRSPFEQVKSSLNWLGVASFEALENYFKESIFAYRRSPAFDLPILKLAAWLRIGEAEQSKLELNAFNPDNLRSRMAEIRSLTLLPPAKWFERIQAIGSECGVAILFVPEFKSFPVSGVTRWHMNNPTIQITLRGKRADKFWFTLFHEIGHVLLHSPKDVFIDVESELHDNPFEAKADEFAANTLIPPAFYDRISASPLIHGMQIEKWAEEIGITPSILLGRLQHDRVIPLNRLNYLHLKVDWETINQ